MSLTQAPRGEDAEAGGAEMRDGSSSSPDRAMSMGFAAPQCHSSPAGSPRLEVAAASGQHWGQAGAGNARGEQGMAALGTLERFVSWRAGLQRGSQHSGFRIQAVSRLMVPGVPVLSSELLHTDVSPPHSTEPCNGELTVCDNLGLCSGWEVGVN